MDARGRTTHGNRQGRRPRGGLFFAVLIALVTSQLAAVGLGAPAQALPAQPNDPIECPDGLDPIDVDGDGVADRCVGKTQSKKCNGISNTKAFKRPAKPGAPKVSYGRAQRCLRLNQIQTLGSHNSYKQHVTPGIFDLLKDFDEEIAQGWEYGHSPLAEQFNYEGIRQIELDIFADPEGGRYAQRVALDAFGLPNDPPAALFEPGFKVLHVQDLDFETSCLTLIECLTQVRKWSKAHKRHMPLAILIEGKTSPIADPLDLGFTVPLPIGPAELDAIDAEIRSVFSDDEMITPDDVRQNGMTLEESILADGWPTLKASRGKVMFLMDNGGQMREDYIAATPSLEGRVMFTNATPGQPDAAFVKMNDPQGNVEVIKEFVRQGYVVRTRSDTPTVEARSGDTTRLEAAVESGAQWISTDYSVPGRAEWSDYVAQLPGGLSLRCNPVNTGRHCDDRRLERVKVKPRVEPPPPNQQLPDGYEGHESEIYDQAKHWICLPGSADDVCARNLDTSWIGADGTVTVVAHEVADDPVADCFYLYPTVSGDPGASSDLDPAEDEEIWTTLNQAARLSGECRVFAPVYRQRTLAALGGLVETPPETRQLAYDDVLDAFKQYVVNHSDGRPFVLIGHSQGAGLLQRLIAEEIDGEPLLADRLLSAMLLGSSVAPDAFDNISACSSTTDTGCVISYATFRDTSPPPSGSFFGRAGDGPALCVNPVDPAAATSLTTPFFATGAGLIGGGVSPFADPSRDGEITTQFYAMPDFLEVRCVDDGTFGYLEMKVLADPDDARADDIGGDLNEVWGMHLVDVNIAMGALTALVAAQGAAHGG